MVLVKIGLLSREFYVTSLKNQVSAYCQYLFWRVSCAANVEIVPWRYFKFNLQTWIALYILQLLAIFYLCVISTLICLGHSFYKDHIQVRRVVIKAIIFQPEYFVSPVMFTIYEYWHLTICQREHFLCMWFTQTVETF